MTTGFAVAPCWDHPVGPAVLPFTEAGLQRVLEKIQRWAPYVDGLLLDDIAAIPDDYMPSKDEVDEHAQQLRGHLMRLVNLAVTSKVDQRDQKVAGLVERGRIIRSEEGHSDRRRAVGAVRQMAWTLNELLELLVENQCLTEEP
ncbi:DUF6415 family natural product biosynthesis protein [Streptomyces sp. TLI_185]|uniref:DUF6415 family natural product biosynthesis protein n=1 Tax=Streptomyces sp. TLI_185 TaxID=2485151 RepID=UPI000F5115DD|nr:DUF6415 family natural product biosynthesis protein [Streptomyces sp. TLI_185]RPF30301.1 hypothetical protein EDD92_0049 [Streptomyces sp. TLI_185]